MQIGRNTGVSPCRAAAVLLCLAAALGCSQPAPPRTPQEAMARAATEIDKLIARRAETPAPKEAAPPMGNQRAVEFWYYAHPLISRAFANASADFPDFQVQSQFIGEWPLAVQKLTAALAANDLPDVALVKRDLVPMLFDAGRIRPLDEVLPKQLIEDLRDEAVSDYRYKNHLAALPADGFCSVLFFNKDLIGPEPPRNWVYLMAYLNARKGAGAGSRQPAFGYFPFLEALWSTGGDVLTADRCALTSPAALRAIDFSLGIWGPSPHGEEGAFRLFEDGALAMTTALSSRAQLLPSLRFPAGVAPIPGETGPISRRSNDALVLFVRDGGASASAIAALMDWVTGPEVMGEHAAAMGSVPLRKSVGAEAALPAGVLEAYQAARNSPLHAQWGGIELELNHGVSEAYRAVTKPS